MSSTMVMCYHLSYLTIWSNTLLTNDVNLNVIFYSQITSALLFPYLVTMRIVEYKVGCYFDNYCISVDTYYICVIVDLRKMSIICTIFDTNGLHDKRLTVQFNILVYFLWDSAFSIISGRQHVLFACSKFTCVTWSEKFIILFVIPGK